MTQDDATSRANDWVRAHFPVIPRVALAFRCPESLRTWLLLHINLRVHDPPHTAFRKGGQ